MSKKKSMHNIPVVRSDYVVIILNAEDEVLDPILDLFYAEVLQRKRRAIAAINRETITEAIVSEKENPDILKARPFVQVGECPPADACLAIINRCTSAWLKENDRFLDIQQLNREYDALAAWTETDDPLIVEPVVKGKGKGKDKPARSTSKTKKPVKLEPLVKVELPVYKVKNWSALALRGQSSNMTVYVEDAPIDGPSMYVVILGVYSKELLVELVRANIPVIAVIKLTTNDRVQQASPERGSYAKYWQEIEHIKPSDSYKPIAFFDVVTHAHPVSILQDHRSQVNDELTCLLYDTQDMRLQHRHYLENMEVQDVGEKRPCVPIDGYPVYNRYFEAMSVQQESVECILDAIVQQVDALAAKPELVKIPLQTHPSLASIVEPEVHRDADVDLRPLKCMFEDKIVLEHGDRIAQSMLGVDDVDFENYQLRLKALSAGWGLQRFDVKIDAMDKIQPQKGVEYTLATLFALGLRPLMEIPRTSTDESVKSVTSESEDAPKVEPLSPLQTDLKSIIEQALKLPNPIQHFVELMTSESMRQQLIECLQTYSNVQQTILPLTDALLVTFSEPTDTMLSSEYEHCLTTPVCLRDYTDYIVDEQAEWIGAQRQENEARQSADLAASAGRRLSSGEIAGDEFMVLRSLKKPHEAPIDVEPAAKPVEVPPPSPKDDNKKGKKRKASMAAKKTTILENLPTLSIDTPVAKPFQGFNLDDRRYQLNGRNVVFRSSLATIRMTFDEWLYRPKTLAIDIRLDDVHITVGKRFGTTGHPLEHIEHVLIQHPDGWRMVLEVVPQPEGREPQLGRREATVPEVCRREEQQERDDGDERMLVVHVVWKNGLTVRTLPTNGAYAVEQVCTKAEHGELRRRMLANGWVVVYFENGCMRVMSSDGMVVQTGDANEWADEEEFVPVAEMANVEAEHASNKTKSSSTSVTGSKKSNPESEAAAVFPIILPHILHGDVLRALMTELPELADRYFKLTTCDGSVFLVDRSEIVKTLKPLHAVELADCALGELFVRRADGLKMIFCSDYTRCLHPDGTEIWSNLFVEDMPSYQDFEFDEINGSTAKNVSIASSIQNLSLESVTSAIKQQQMVATVVDKFIQNSADECFEYVDRSFTVRHAAYEEVVFQNSNEPCVRFPHRAETVYTRGAVKSQLTATVGLSCDLAEYRFTAEQCALHQKQTSVRIVSDQDEQLILDCADGFGRRFTIDRWAKSRLVEDFALPQLWQEARLCGCPRRKTLRTRHFVLGRQFDGYEIVPQALVEQITADALYVHRDGDTICVLHPVEELEPVVVPHSETDKFYTPVHNVKCCVPTVDISVKHMAEIPPITLLRYFVRVPQVHADLHEQMQQQQPARKAVSRSKSKSDELPSIRNLLCEAAVKAMQALLKAKEEAYIELTNPAKKPLSKKAIKHKKEVQDEFSRAHLYRRMLRTGFIPRYETFHLAHYHVRNLDADEMNAAMDQLEIPKDPDPIPSTDSKPTTPDVPTTVNSFAKQFTSDAPIKCHCSHTPCCCNYLC